MARRSDHSREELRELILEKAREVAETEGLRGLTARRIARDVGYTIGTLYNHFDDLDDLIVQMNGWTLDALFQALSEVELRGEPEQDLSALADRYVGFVSDHPRLWSILFDHHLPEGRELPGWHREKVLRLLGLIENAIAPLCHTRSEAEQIHVARVLWSSLHGICSLGTADKMAPDETVSALAHTLVAIFLAGLSRS